MTLRSSTENENGGTPLHRIVLSTRHSRARGNPGLFPAELTWIPAFAGMTERDRFFVHKIVPPRIFEGGTKDTKLENFTWRNLNSEI